MHVTRHPSHDGFHPWGNEIPRASTFLPRARLRITSGAQSSVKRRSSTALYYDDFDRISYQFLRNDNAANESLIKPLSLAECEHLVRTYHCRKSGRYLYQYMGLMGSERALLRT